MSLQNNSPSYLGNALIGAFCAILLSVPTSALLARFLGDTYLVRVWVYSGFLLWVIAGAMTIFFRTYKGEKNHLSIRFITLWFISVWFWPLLICFGKKRE